MKHYVRFLVSFILPLGLFLIPIESFPIDSFTVAQLRVLVIFLIAALSWILEPIPIFATSILVITLELVFLSDRSLIWARTANPDEMLPYADIFSAFASPIILLFVGGFFLAIAATKFRLDINLARIMLRPFGTNPKMIILGLMLITALFSMFMSNTATTAMMLSILMPVLATFDQNDRGKTAIALSIPFAANIGGMGTPIGTPPNAVALKYLTGENAVSFGEWMTFGVPLVIVLLLIVWWLLLRFFPVSTPKISLSISGEFLKNRRAIIVYVTFVATILLWLTDFIHGMNSYIVAMVPVSVFLATGIINKEDLKKVSWDVLWLVSGGIALGYAMEATGLAKNLINSIPLGEFSPLIVIGFSAILAVIMANFMSNTATANLLLPIAAALGTSISSLAPLGGAMMLILCVGLASSLGMSLPISTPPNALAHGTGIISTRDMSRTGVIAAIIGLVAIFSLMYILNILSFFP